MSRVRVLAPTAAAPNTRRTPGGDWREQAACLGYDPEIFFPLVNAEAIAAAKHICHECPVTADCLAFAHRVSDRWAILGGLTADERNPRSQELKRKRAGYQLAYARRHGVKAREPAKTPKYLASLARERAS